MSESSSRLLLTIRAERIFIVYETTKIKRLLYTKIINKTNLKETNLKWWNCGLRNVNGNLLRQIISNLWPSINIRHQNARDANEKTKKNEENHNKRTACCYLRQKENKKKFAMHLWFRTELLVYTRHSWCIVSLRLLFLYLSMWRGRRDSIKSTTDWRWFLAIECDTFGFIMRYVITHKWNLIMLDAYTRDPESLRLILCVPVKQYV